MQCGEGSMQQSEGQLEEEEEIRAFQPPHPSHALGCTLKPELPPAAARCADEGYTRRGTHHLHTPQPTHIVRRLQIRSSRHQCRNYRFESIRSCLVKRGCPFL